MKQTVAWYNSIPNLVWSILNLVPISIFCYKLINLKLFFAFLAISLLTVLLPKSFFHSIQLGKTTSVYKKIGVNFINKFTQNGKIINRLIRKRFPQYKVVSNRKRSINKLIQQTYVFERFHFILFSFFNFITVYALVKNYFWWALIIVITNILYNIYPCFLQQYIRVRLASSMKKNNIE